MPPSLLLALALHAGPAAAGPVHVLPERREAHDAIEAAWAVDAAGWRTSPSRSFPSGTRVGALVEVPAERALDVQVQVVGADGPAAWRPLRETWRGEGARVLVLDLDRPATQARLRVRGAPDAVSWELRTPVDEPRGVAASPPPSVSPTLAALGVVPRETWGARATDCTSTEDDWYRMAIHHTAGSQTSGGTVQGAVQALQAYAMDSAGYCDIPYQFLVGHDGSLWEGRSLTWYSGATGGGNNDGNIAVSFLGCYTGSGCPGDSHAATDVMIAWARALIWTLADEHGFWPDAGTVKGHRDYPGNSTVCPGDYVYARLDELVDEGGYYAGTVVDAALPVGSTVALPVGDATELWVDLRNDGMRSWTPGLTWLAPLPRDAAHPLATAEWASATRIATVDAAVAPGATARLAVPLRGVEEGTTTLSLAMVEEGVTWFSDLPWGGGPAEGALAYTVVVSAAGGADSGPGGGVDTGPDGGSGGGPGGSEETGWGGWSGGDPPPGGADPRPGQAVPLDGLASGCACAAAPARPAALGPLAALLALVLGVARRRR